MPKPAYEPGLKALHDLLPIEDCVNCGGKAERQKPKAKSRARDKSDT
jgi:hypothetical protein